MRLLKSEAAGKTVHYYIDKDNPHIESFRVFENKLYIIHKDNSL